MTSISKLSRVWLAELETRGCSHNTIDLYKRNISELNSFLIKLHKSKEVGIENITRESLVLAINEYKERKDKRNGKIVQRSQSSINSYYTSIKTFLNWCESCDHLQKSY